MVYLQQIAVGKKQYWALYHTIRTGGKVKRVSKYIGKVLPPPKKLEKLKERFAKEIAVSITKQLLSAEQTEALNKIKDQYRAHLEKLTSLDLEKLDEFIATNFTYNTNAIEGSRLSLADVQSIFKGIVPQGKDLREIYGAENMRKAYNYLKTMKMLSEKRILELHKIAMQDVLSVNLGKYRDVQVYVGNHIPPPPEKVGPLMKGLLAWYKIASKKLHPFELASILHVKFELIHPFRDGNGRVGRLIMNFVLLNAGCPLLDIKFDLRPGYYAALQASQNGNFAPFVNYAFEIYIEDAKKRGWL